MRDLFLLSAARVFAPVALCVLALSGCGATPQLVGQGPTSVEVEWPTNSSAGAQAQDIGAAYCAASGKSAAMVMENWHGAIDTARFECR